MVNDSRKGDSPLMPTETTGFLEIQTLRIGRRRSSPTAGLLYSQEYYSCRLISAKPSKSSALLPQKLKKRLIQEMREWRNPREAFELLSRRVAHDLDRVNESRTALRANDDAWDKAYAFLESLEEVFL